MDGLWESKCDLCGLPLADHIYNPADPEDEWPHRQWICPRSPAKR